MFIGIYNTLVRTLYPMVIRRYIEKRKKMGKEDVKRFNERVGRPTKPRPDGRLIWLHGASVGESISMLPLINRLLEIYPDAHVMVTTGTTTSAEVMAKRLPERAFHQYLPIDNPVFAARFVRHWQPTIVLWFESEFWPAMLSTIKRRNIPLILINGRISNKSFKRWQQFDFVIKEILDCFTACLGQSEEDAYRLRALGAKDAMCLGNLKYAGLPIPVDEEKKKEIQDEIGSRPVWLVSSTHSDEEAKIGRYLKDLSAKHEGLLTIIAPRHPTRGVEIQNILNEKYQLKTALRSANEKITPETEVYIADTIGEMGIWYELCPIVFIGGSLIPHGGQNFMEPSRCRDAVIVGPHMHNFTDAMNRAKRADGIIQVDETVDLIDMVDQLLSNKELLEAKRSLAYNWATSEAKVLDGIAEKIQGYMENENT
ncbi:MAG TPA: 3-deoxy-D-manno-octulosonic acid transferase [Alphaproteobacteria bacterium]|nr:3-deoxy-D-manno-octulosonic acid transferase [Alphaproteobacteria bacterium]